MMICMRLDRYLLERANSTRTIIGVSIEKFTANVNSECRLIKSLKINIFFHVSFHDSGEVTDAAVNGFRHGKC
jgi:hypothetical protein